MSVPRCGICNAPSMTGPLCRDHIGRLEDLLDRAPEVAASLAGGAARGPESGGSRSTTAPLPISVPVMEAKRALGDALYGAQRVICPGVPRLVVRDAVALLRAHSRRLRASYAAPVLLVDLEAAVGQGVRAVDKPRGRMSVPGRCRECGPSMLHLVGGLLECDRCSERMSIGEVRAAG